MSLAWPCFQHTSFFGLMSSPNQNAVICYCHLLAKASSFRTFLHGSYRKSSNCINCHFTCAKLSHGLGKLSFLQGHLQREMAQCLIVLVREELQICGLHGIVSPSYSAPVSCDKTVESVSVVVQIIWKSKEPGVTAEQKKRKTIFFSPCSMLSPPWSVYL